MPNKLIKDLIDKGAVILKEQGYSIRSSEYTLLTWKQFQEFCTKRGYETYLPSHKDEFIAELGKFTPPLRQSTIDRKAGSMKMLNLLATKGTIGNGMRWLINRAANIRKIEPFEDSILMFEKLLPLMNVTFVHNGQLTIIPFPFKYLREHLNK